MWTGFGLLDFNFQNKSHKCFLQKFGCGLEERLNLVMVSDKLRSFQQTQSVPQANWVIKTCKSSPKNVTYAFVLGGAVCVVDSSVSSRWLLIDKFHSISYFSRQFAVGRCLGERSNEIFFTLLLQEWFFWNDLLRDHTFELKLPSFLAVVSGTKFIPFESCFCWWRMNELSEFFTQLSGHWVCEGYWSGCNMEVWGVLSWRGLKVEEELCGSLNAPKFQSPLVPAQKVGNSNGLGKHFRIDNRD